MDQSGEASLGQRIFGTILSCLIVLAGVFWLESWGEGVPLLRYASEDAALQVPTTIARNVADALGCDVHPELAVAYSDGELNIIKRGVFGPLDRLVLLAFIDVAATVAVCRAWRLGQRRSMVLILLSVAIPLPLALVLMGTFTGVALGFSESMHTAAMLIYPARDAALLATSGAVALSWWLPVWLWEDEDRSSTSQQSPRVLVPSLWAAMIAAAGLAAIRALAGGGLVFQSYIPSGTTAPEGGIGLRWAMGAGLLAMSAGMVGWSIWGRNGFARWAWIPVMGLAFLGGGAAGPALVFLALVIGSRDATYRANRGLRAESAPLHDSMRPLTGWIWVLLTVLVGGAYLRTMYVRYTTYPGVSVLAHPAVFGTTLVLTACCVVWDWKTAGRRFGGQWTLIAASVLAAATAWLYGVGVAREVTLRHRMATAEAYFQSVENSMAKVPLATSVWSGSEAPPPPLPLPDESAKAMLSRRYVDFVHRFRADLLIVDWHDRRNYWARDPQLQFPTDGWKLKSSSETDWTVGNKTLTGTTYLFNRDGDKEQLVVATFLLFPDGTVCRTMPKNPPGDQVKGVAMFEVMLAGDIPPESRHQVEADLLSLARPVMEAVGNSGD